MSNCVTPQTAATRLPHPWDSPGKNTGVGCHFLLPCMKVKSESEFAQSCPTLSNPMDCTLPGSSIHGIFQAKYWSGVPLPSPFLWDDCVNISKNSVFRKLKQGYLFAIIWSGLFMVYLLCTWSTNYVPTIYLVCALLVRHATFIISIPHNNCARRGEYWYNGPRRDELLDHYHIVG